MTDGVQRSEPSEYDLKIDAQTEKFLDLKQKLTYFLITASVTPIAFALTFMQDKLDSVAGLWYLLAAGTLSGLGSAGSALQAIHLELRSYRIHIKTRYCRKEWDDLCKDQRDRWDGINKSAARFLKWSFLLLFFEIVLLAIFFMLVLLKRSVGGSSEVFEDLFY